MISPGKQGDLPVLDRSGHQHTKNVPPQTLFVSGMTTVHENAHFRSREFFFPLYQVSDRLAFGRVRVHLQEPADTFRFEKSGIKCEGGSDANQRFTSLRRGLPKFQSFAADFVTLTPAHRHPSADRSRTI